MASVVIFAARTPRVDDAWPNAKVELFNRRLYWRTSTERYYVDEQARYLAHPDCDGDIAARALGALCGRGDNSCHPRRRRRRYSTDRYARCRAAVWLAVPHQRNRRRDH